MIRVLIAAASGVIRAGLESLLRSSSTLEVVGSAADLLSHAPVFVHVFASIVVVVPAVLSRRVAVAQS